MNQFISIAAFILGAFQILYLINIVWSLYKGKKADKNPWKAATLEWSVDFPIPHGNFEQIPTVYHGPHEYSNPKTADDWAPQSVEIK